MQWAVDNVEQAIGLPLAPLLVRRPLEQLLDRHGLGEGPIEAELIGEGNSNVTIALTRGGERFVLRRPPRPPFQATAHDVVREAHIQRALAGTDVPVPTVLLVHEEPDVLGVPFYIMEWLDGHVLTSQLPAKFDGPGTRRLLVEEMVGTLATLHSVQWRGSELAALGRRDRFLERQMRRWIGVWEHTQERELPAVDAVGNWLAANLPESSDVTLVHGDFRLGNLMFDRTQPRLRAVLDWEIATLGDPLVDIGWLLSTYPEPGDDTGALLSLASCLRSPDAPTRAELVELYEKFTNRALPDLRWYVTFSFWRAAVGLESLYVRRRLSTTGDSTFLEELKHGVPELVDRARAAMSARPE